ncbi:MAG: hypothetical protein WC873_03275 [Candidatus Gracilibacteria bacterium]
MENRLIFRNAGTPELGDGIDGLDGFGTGRFGSGLGRGGEKKEDLRRVPGALDRTLGRLPAKRKPVEPAVKESAGVPRGVRVRLAEVDEFLDFTGPDAPYDSDAFLFE